MSCIPHPRCAALRTAACLCLLLAAAGGVAAQASTASFDTMLDRLEKALALLTTADVPTSYEVFTVFEISDGKKKLLQTIELRERVTLEPGKPARRETLSRKTVGDASPDANSGASRRSGEGGGGSSWNAVFPVAKDRARFSFGPEQKRGALIAVGFAPASGASTDGLTRGTLVWDPAAAEPSRLQAVPVKNPPFMSRLEFSFDFAAVDGVSYPKTVSFSGEGGVLFFRRQINSVSTLSEFSRKS
jgi:hypothetical protein